ncbi:hypothetical protein [Streptomyces qinglanensis]|uniref:hypothetical protein n=1 Tax=Streptomyces qinglanensis TaxID=943816 RepID=UPI003D75FBAF
MGRTDRASRAIAASPATVYGALLDREALEAWASPRRRARADRAVGPAAPRRVPDDPHLPGSGVRPEVAVTATGVPPGSDPAPHEAGLASSPANLASYVEDAG